MSGRLKSWPGAGRFGRRALFAHRRAAKVTRYDLPLLCAFNFVIDDVLEGGVNGSLNLDGQGKTNSCRPLSF